MADEDWIGPMAQSLLPDLEQSLGRIAQYLRGSVDSPIELKFITALWAGLRLGNYDCVLLRMDEGAGKFDELCKKHDFVICLQYKWRRYRSDMCFGGRAIGQLVLVECDGHNFHERTKEQAVHDRKKDMQAQLDGFNIIRFTGSQIFRDAIGCTIELINFVAERAVAKEGATA